MRPEVRMPEVGRRLSAARLQRGLSQGTVARRAGIAPSYLSRIENGRIQPTFRTVVRIQQAMKADLEELVGPGSTSEPRGGCPVSGRGVCLLDLIRTESEVLRSRAPGEFYTPREIKLLRRLAFWMKSVRPDRLLAMEIVLEDLMRGASPPPEDHR